MWAKQIYLKISKIIRNTHLSRAKPCQAEPNRAELNEAERSRAGTNKKHTQKNNSTHTRKHSHQSIHHCAMWSNKGENHDENTFKFYVCPLPLLILLLLFSFAGGIIARLGSGAAAARRRCRCRRRQISYCIFKYQTHRPAELKCVFMWNTTLHLVYIHRYIYISHSHNKSMQCRAVPQARSCMRTVKQIPY